MPKTVETNHQYVSKEEIRERGKLKIKEVFVPQWGGKVRYRTLSLNARREVRKDSSTSEKNRITGEEEEAVDVEKFEVNALIYCVLEADSDNLMFEQSDASWLEKDMAA